MIINNKQEKYILKKLKNIYNQENGFVKYWKKFNENLKLS